MAKSSNRKKSAFQAALDRLASKGKGKAKSARASKQNKKRKPVRAVGAANAALRVANQRTSATKRVSAKRKAPAIKFGDPGFAKAARAKKQKGRPFRKGAVRKAKVNAQSELDAVTLALHRAGIPLANTEGKACATVADRVQVALDRLAGVASVGRMNENAPPATGAASSAS